MIGTATVQELYRGLGAEPRAAALARDRASTPSDP